jgi:hypothetical protein
LHFFVELDGHELDEYELDWHELVLHDVRLEHGKLDELELLQHFFFSGIKFIYNFMYYIKILWVGIY